MRRTGRQFRRVSLQTVIAISQEMADVINDLKKMKDSVPQEA